MKTSEITIRDATADDSSAILAIYAPYVKNTAISFEYEVPSEADFKARGFRSIYACIAHTDRENDPYLTDASPRFHEKQGWHFVGKFTDCAYKFGLWYNMVYYEKHI